MESPPNMSDSMQEGKFSKKKFKQSNLRTEYKRAAIDNKIQTFLNLNLVELCLAYED